MTSFTSGFDLYRPLTPFSIGSEDTFRPSALLGLALAKLSKAWCTGKTRLLEIEPALHVCHERILALGLSAQRFVKLICMYFSSDIGVGLKHAPRFPGSTVTGIVRSSRLMGPVLVVFLDV